MLHELLLPMFAHVLLLGSLYVLLTIARAPAVWGVGRNPDGANPLAVFEPRISANLKNQFEWPMLFYVACLLSELLALSSAALPVLAWLFVTGRVLHSGVQILTSNVRLRGIVFTLNFMAVLAMWAVIVIES